MMADNSESGDPAEPPIRFDREQVLKRFGGDGKLLGEMITIFCEESPRIMNSLDTGLAQRDCHTVELAAHSLRGMTSYFDVTSVIESARQIEYAAKRGELDETPSMAQQLKHQVELLEQLLQGCR
jgi:HPt (histidine-containing phosphotransfer) domain-containing protein